MGGLPGTIQQRDKEHAFRPWPRRFGLAAFARGGLCRGRRLVAEPRGAGIVSVNQRPVASPQEAAAALKRAAASGNVLLLLNRNGVTEFLGMTIEHGAAPGDAG